MLEPPEFLDAASLMETAGWVRLQFREQAAKFPLLTARAASLSDFRDVLAAIRRCVLPNGEISDDASAALRRIRANIVGTRDSIQKSLRQILREQKTIGTCADIAPHTLIFQRRSRVLAHSRRSPRANLR